MAVNGKKKILMLSDHALSTSGVGVQSRFLINGLIDRLRKANEELGITLCVIEHNMRVIMNLASNIYCLANGKVLANGVPSELQKDKRVIDAYLGGH